MHILHTVNFVKATLNRPYFYARFVFYTSRPFECGIISNNTPWAPPNISSKKMLRLRRTISNCGVRGQSALPHGPLHDGVIIVFEVQPAQNREKQTLYQVVLIYQSY